MATAERLRTQAGPEARRRSRSSEAGGRRRRASRSSSSSAMTRAGSTTTSGSSATVRSRAGPSRRGSRSSPEIQHLAVHVEDHPLEYASFEGEIPAGQLRRGHGRDLGPRDLRAGRGEARRRPDRAAPRASGSRGCGRSCRRSSPAIRRTGCCSGSAATARPRSAAAELRADARHARRTTCRSGPGWEYELKFDGFRAIGSVRGGEAHAHEPHRQRPHDALRRTSPGGCPAAMRTPDCRARRGGLRAGRAGPRHVLGDAAGLRGDRVLRLRRARGRRRAARRTCRSPSGARGWRRCSIRPREPSGCPRAFTTAPGCSPRSKEQGLEGIVAKRADSPYRPGKRTREWVKVKASPRQEFVICGLHAGAAGGGRPTLGALVLGAREGDELVWVGNVGTGFERGRRSTGCSGSCGRSSARPAVRRRAARCRESGATTSSGWSRSSLRGRVRRVDARRAPAGPVVSGTARGQGGRPRCEREVPMESTIRRGRRTLELSNLDKPFWPEEGITKGDLVRYYRDVASGARPAPARAARSR